MNPFYSRVADQAGHCCEYCHAPEVVFNFPFEVEHIMPLSKQGTNL
ncbi:HNH endonuclease [Leptolyngbya sp. AN03gr2]